MSQTAKPTFYAYGGMKYGQNTKLHICDNKGVALCGVQSNWMEAGEIIPDSGYVHANYWIGNIADFDGTCKKCLTKWKTLVVQK